MKNYHVTRYGPAVPGFPTGKWCEEQEARQWAALGCSVCLVEKPKLSIKRPARYFAHFALVLCLIGCSSNPFAGEQHIWSGVDDDPKYAANKTLHVVTADETMQPLLEYGAAWWAETSEPSIVFVDSCNEKKELCADTEWFGVKPEGTGYDGGEGFTPSIGTRGVLRMSSEVLTVKGMPEMLPGLVAAHELGHMFGRGHVSINTELMAPNRDWKPTEVCIDGEHCRQYGSAQ